MSNSSEICRHGNSKDWDGLSSWQLPFSLVSKEVRSGGHVAGRIVAYDKPGLIITITVTKEDKKQSASKETQLLQPETVKQKFFFHHLS